MGQHWQQNVLLNEGNLEANRAGTDGRFLRSIIEMGKYNFWTGYSLAHLQLYLGVSQGRVQIFLD
jgi:hypothetical protein